MIRQERKKLTILWLLFGLLSLTVAGFLSFILVIGRLPWCASFPSIPLLAKKSLVVHVNLAMVFWLSAIFISLFVNRFSAATTGQKTFPLPLLAIIGGALMVFSIALPAAEPILSNYIPVLMHPVFFIGFVMALFSIGLAYGMGVLSLSFNREIKRKSLTALDWGLLHVAVGYLIFLLTVLVTGWKLGAPQSGQAYFDALFWGAGHVLQSVNVMGMLIVWMIIAKELSPDFQFSIPQVRWVFGLLLMPLFLAPWLAFHVRSVAFYYLSFTRLMQWGIFPGVFVFWGIFVFQWWKKKIPLFSLVYQNPLGLGLFASMGLLLIGFVMGMVIRSSNTLIPAHYHAAIGSITVACMLAVYWFLFRFSELSITHRQRQLVRWQPVLFGAGQTLFAFGFAIARLARKVYGPEQLVQYGYQYLGLVLMAIGGLLAISGGILFVWFAAKWFPWKFLAITIKERRFAWAMLKNIPSRN